MKNIHFVNINNYPLCRYLRYIINNNLTDDDDIARQKRCLYAQANVLARICCLCSTSQDVHLKSLVQIHKSELEKHYRLIQ